MPSAPSAHSPAVRTVDRFGNRIDPQVAYARGAILAGDADEVARQRHAYGLIRARRAALGEEAIHNLTGLIRGFPYRDDDPPSLRSYIHFGMEDRGALAEEALARMGSSTEQSDGFLCNRVSAAMLATMLALLARDDLVLSLVPADRSHPSVRQAVTTAGGRFAEAIGIDAFETLIHYSDERPAMVVITAISPSKHHLPEAHVLRAMALARVTGAIVFVDDAHMAARLSVYGERPSLALGADLAVWSLDKHVTGPRSGFIAGNPDLIRAIRAKAFAFGLEAQPGQIVAGLNAVRDFDPAPVRAAHAFAESLMPAIQRLVDGRAYMAGPGIAVAGEDLMEVALARSGRNEAACAPIEGVAAAAMTLLEETGAVTIPAVGMPGAACVYRLMMYPDGARLGAAPIVAGTRAAVDWLADHLGDPQAIRRRLLDSP